MAKVLNLVPGWNKRYPTRGGGFVVITKRGTGTDVFLYQGVVYREDREFGEFVANGESFSKYGTVDGEDPDDIHNHEPNDNDIISDVPLPSTNNPPPVQEPTEPPPTNGPFMVEGGWYLTRIGMLVGPLKPNGPNTNTSYPWEAHDWSYTDTGHELQHDEGDNDLVTRVDPRIEAILNVYTKEVNLAPLGTADNFIQQLLESQGLYQGPQPSPKKNNGNPWFIGDGSRVGSRSGFYWSVDLSSMGNEQDYSCVRKRENNLFERNRFYQRVNAPDLLVLPKKPTVELYMTVEPERTYFYGCRTENGFVRDVTSGEVYAPHYVTSLTTPSDDD